MKLTKRKQNVIIFSAGESIRNGTVEYIQNKLGDRGILCFDWRSLFSHAHNMEQIALLPALLKKIPTFDFALIVAEGVDTVKLRGSEERSAIRDNVIFELGLCTMALGAERVILLAEENVRIPEDLIGVGKMGIEYVTFSSVDREATIGKVGEIIDKKADVLKERFMRQLSEIIEHINKNSEQVSPVFVGAAVSSAEAYFINFIVRLFENIDKGFSSREHPEKVYPCPDRIKLCICLPSAVSMSTRSMISVYFKKHGYEDFFIGNAGIRGLFFNGRLDESDSSLLIVDVPTSITASYVLVNSVLSIDSDADYDASAEERFVTKEMDIYAFALNKLLSPEVARKRLLFIHDSEKIERILNQLQKVSIEFMDITI